MLSLLLYYTYFYSNVTSTVFEKGYLNFMPELLISTLIVFFILAKVFDKGNYKNFVFSFFLINLLSVYLLSIYNFKNINIFFLNFNYLYSSDFTSNLFKVFVIILTSSILLFTLIKENIELNNKRKTTSKNNEYIILVAFGLLLFLIIISSHDLFLTYITLEGLSLLVTIMIVGYGPIFKSTEAAIKYFSISAFTAGFVLFGISLIYKKIQTTNFTEIKKYINLIIETNNTYEITSLSIILIFVMAGFLFKLTIAPFHLWANEVYGNIPLVTLSFIFLPYKFSILVSFFKILIQGFYGLSWIWGPILLILAITCIFWGSVGALYEDKIKKFLVFASINQTGFILLGFGSATFYGISASLMHFVFYFISTVGLFSYLLAVKFYNTDLKISYIHQLQYIKTPLIYKFFLIIIIFSMMGFPPFMGFFTKYFLLIETFSGPGLFFMLTILALNIISAFYYFRLIKNLFFFKIDKQMNNNQIKNSGLIIINSILFILIALILSIGWIELDWIVNLFDLLSDHLIYPYYNNI